MTVVETLEPTVLGAGWQHRRIVAIWMAIALLVALMYLAIRPNTYQGTASIVVQQGLGPGGAAPVVPERFVADQAALLRSPVVVERAQSILNQRSGSVPNGGSGAVGPVSVSSSATDSELTISVRAGRAAAAEAEVRAVLDAFRQLQNESAQAVTDNAVRQIDTAVADLNAQQTRLNASAANGDPQIASQLAELTAERTSLQQQRNQITVNGLLSSPSFIVSSQPEASRRGLGAAIKLIVVALVLGFLVGMAHAYLIRLRRRRFNGKHEPHSVVTAPLLIDVPHFDVNPGDGQLVVRDVPTSRGAEAFAFAAQMQLGIGNAVPKRGVAIAMTSARGDSGTTTVVANLGLALARSGLNVLLIDGGTSSVAPHSDPDRHHPSLTELFLGSDRASTGLEDVIEGVAPLAEAVTSAGDRRLALLSSGGGQRGANVDDLVWSDTGAATAAEPTYDGVAADVSDGRGPLAVQAETTRDVLAAAVQPSVVPSRHDRLAVDELLADARERFDCVLIDTPGVLRIGARGVLVQAADQVVLVIDHGERIDPVQEATERIHAVGATVAGYVYNRRTARRDGRHGRFRRG
jgi:Mrp family chromosome partitioning ATPase